jgi:hypothetical protein
MHFGPLEIQACGENNFTMKALGLLAFRQDLRARLVENLAGPGAISKEDGDINILFFSRIGENFLRDGIERERMAKTGEFENRINRFSNLPSDFRWHRKKDGRLTQPAKWQAKHLAEMLERNGRPDDQDLHDHLDALHKCLNTEPDVVIQWGRKLALIEIKVLSSQGDNQIGRQMRLGRLICDLLDWDQPLFFMIGPEHGGRPKQDACRFFSWKTVAEWFEDVPEIASYIRSFAFFYRGKWQSMLSSAAANPGPTAYDLLPDQPMKKPHPPMSVALLNKTVMGMPMPSTPQGPIRMNPDNDPWHFSHLGPDYFRRIFRVCNEKGICPSIIWLGISGVEYIEIKKGRKINPKWMVEGDNGRFITQSTAPKSGYVKTRMQCVSYETIVNWPDWSKFF